MAWCTTHECPSNLCEPHHSELQSVRKIVEDLALDSLLKQVGADRPKQTRPNDAKWCNNMIQVRLIGGEWFFWKFENRDPANPKQWDFIDGKKMVKQLKEEFAKDNGAEFRLVAIVEVF